ncbi:MAG: flagellar FlbD family protein [Leptospiraceae bacterium]|nr:flagellar FlbD family protein [Leptospiraceae bacterium]MCK6381201.1 flagellar FlbD family protein [Leptospiraceae bacterium]NUM42246.1 flagellar FlbD family protein [Leptospiraceae bacterium]
MIVVHRLNKSEVVINASQIESLESTPDTVIVLVNDKRYIVRETISEVIDKVIEYKKKIFQFPFNGTEKKG